MKVWLSAAMLALSVTAGSTQEQQSLELPKEIVVCTHYDQLKEFVARQRGGDNSNVQGCWLVPAGKKLAVLEQYDLVVLAATPIYSVGEWNRVWTYKHWVEGRFTLPPR